MGGCGLDSSGSEYGFREVGEFLDQLGTYQLLKEYCAQWNYSQFVGKFVNDDDQWRYSPDRALASLTGFMIVYTTMWGYQLHDRPILDNLIQPSETSSSNYQRLSW
jgi:hypothetical protein